MEHTSGKPSLPPAQQRVYDRLLDHYSRNGELPDLSEFARQLKLHYVSLKQHLQALDKKGYLKFESRGHGRSPLLQLHPAATGIPVLGGIPAGPLSEAAANADEFLPLHGVRGASFALRVDGNSMADLIQPDDIVIFEKRQPFRSGEICAVRVGENDVTLKYLDFVKPDLVTLRPHNPEYMPMTMPAAEISVEGTYLGLMRGQVAAALLESID